ncbi:hypothetical protein [Ferrimonas sp.]|uniref:hypothetical protein n=1 Tax=Ferrimonas sp. TaxID=2080861 RepID=UPI003A92936D
MSRWQWLFWIDLAVAIGAMMAVILIPAPSFALWTLLSLTVLLIHPSFGYAYQVPIGSLWLARLNAGLVILCFAFILLMSVIMVYQHPDLLHLLEFVLIFAAILVLMHPPYQYAFCSPHLWQKQDHVVHF